MKLYSYVVARDFGFAPNPFYGFCTLATCKPIIRKKAQVGDWVVGTGAKTIYNLQGHLIYAMQVSEVLDFDAYWADERFRLKRPDLNGSLKVMYGDNIYHRDGGTWLQADSHHSLDGGAANQANIEWDTGVNRLLVSERFVYWGAEAPEIPKDLQDICAGRGHRVFEGERADNFVRWLEHTDRWGVQGEPLEFAEHRRRAR